MSCDIWKFLEKTCVDVFTFNMFKKNKTEAEQLSNIYNYEYRYKYREKYILCLEIKRQNGKIRDLNKLI